MPRTAIINFTFVVKLPKDSRDNYDIMRLIERSGEHSYVDIETGSDELLISVDQDLTRPENVTVVVIGED